MSCCSLVPYCSLVLPSTPTHYADWLIQPFVLLRSSPLCGWHESRYESTHTPVFPLCCTITATPLSAFTGRYTSISGLLAMYLTIIYALCFKGMSLLILSASSDKSNPLNGLRVDSHLSFPTIYRTKLNHYMKRWIFCGHIGIQQNLLSFLSLPSGHYYNPHPLD